MQIPIEWVPPILSIIGMLGALVAVFLTKVSSKRERENIAEQVRLYRETNARERYLDALIECHRFLLKGIRVSALMANKPTPAPSSLLRELMSETEGIIVSLIKSSWMCMDLGEKVRESAIALRQIFSQEDSSNVAKETGVAISRMLDTIAKRIQELLHENSD
jgi:hypothetical protein